MTRGSTQTRPALVFVFAATCVAALGGVASNAWALGQNLALGQTVTRSAGTSVRPSSRVNDGNTNGLSADVAEIYPWTAEDNAWVQIDLGSVRQVAAVEVWGSTEACAAPGGSCALDEAAVILSESPIQDSWANGGTFEASVRWIALDHTLGRTVLVPFNRPTRYVRLWNNRTGARFQVAEIRVFEAHSAAQGRTCTQSSVYNGREARFACDGKTSSDVAGGSIAQTNTEATPWWEVDLQMMQAIRQIDVRIRRDNYTFPGGYLFLSEKPMVGRSYTDIWNDPTVIKHGLLANNDTKRLYVNRRARYVRVQVNSQAAQSLALAEVQVWALATGALWSTATQSSTYGANGPELAVDGNTEGNLAAGSVAHTLPDGTGLYSAPPWWQVDLGGDREIESLTLWNRADCCSERLSGFYVFVSPFPFSEDDSIDTLSSHPDVATFYYPSGYGSVGKYASLPIGVTGRHVRIQLDDYDSLQLAEVEVFARDGFLTSPKNGATFSSTSAAITFTGFAPLPGSRGHVEIQANDCDNVEGCSEDSVLVWRTVATAIPEEATTTTKYSPNPLHRFTVTASIPTTSLFWVPGGAISVRAVMKAPYATAQPVAHTLRTVDTDDTPCYYWPRTILLSSSPTPASVPVKPVFLGKKPILTPTETSEYYAAVDALKALDGGGLGLKDLASFENRHLNGYTGAVTAKYYNSGDLGLGRIVKCSKRVTGLTACIVYNQGSFDTREVTLWCMFDPTASGCQPPPAVAMVSRDHVAEGTPNKVVFAVFDPTGPRRTNVALDILGHNKSIPSNCTVCHGGDYDAAKNAVTNARFLPFDFTSVEFNTTRFPEYNRGNLEEPFRRLNEIAYGASTTAATKELIRGWYGSEQGLRTAGTKQNDAYTPPGWNEDLKQRKLYDKLIRPYCRTCHVAITRSEPYTFTKYDDVMGSALTPFVLGDVCKNHTMPNAVETTKVMWRHSARAHLLGAFKLQSEVCDGTVH